MAQDEDFGLITQELQTGGIAVACKKLAEILKRDRRYHELFDARLMQCRQKLGLPLTQEDGDFDAIAEPIRSQFEEGYLSTCREVGQLLLDDGQIRQAWMYLRPAGENELMRDALEKIQPTDENTEELIEVGLYEGANIRRGFQLVLQQYGTCNAITTFESAMHGRKKSEQQEVAGMLVRWLHEELLGNLLSDLEMDAEQAKRDAVTLEKLVAGREEMFGEYTTHIDVSHLGSVVRFARVVEDPEVLRLAYDLTEYGRRLHENFQHEGDAPFANHYVSHGLFFAAQLGNRVDEAIEYFRAQAEAADLQVDTTAAVEVYIALLTRLGHYDDAIRAHIELVPEGIQLSGFAPSLLELSRLSGNYRPLMDVCRERGDVLGFAIGQMETQLSQAQDPPAADASS